MSKYYDGTKLLSMRDINGNIPEIYMCTTNRTGGKTTYFNRLALNRFIKNKDKFILIKRFNGEIKGSANAFFKDISGLFFRGHEMDETIDKEYGYGILAFDGNPCGYVMALNTADKIKKISHFFSDAKYMLFDEFQSETNHYCPDEVTKFISLHTSVARGQGEQVRYVPVYMISNPVTLLNPYYSAMDISYRLKANTKFLRGNGFVLENGYVASAAEAQKASGFNAAFANHKYVAYSSEGVYLNDSFAFIEKMKGKGRYICTIKYKNESFGLYEFTDQGIVYCSRKYNPECTTRLAITTIDHEINYVMLQRYEFMIAQLRVLFEKGCFRFADILCKEVIMKMLSYY